MRGKELFASIDEVKTDVFKTVVFLFEFGYAKGYRAAMAEMKKGGPCYMLFASVFCKGIYSS